MRSSLVCAVLLALLAPLDARAAPSPRALLELADLSGLALSPDGRTIAFREERASVARNTYDSVWLAAPVDGVGGVSRLADGGAPLRYDFGGAINAPATWSPDSQWIYYRALLGGQIQVWRASRDGAQVEAVTRDAADVKAFALSADGRSLVYAVGADREAIARAETDEDDAGVRIDETVPIGQGLVRSALINGRLATQRLTGAWSDRQGLLAGQADRHRIVDLKTLEAREAQGADGAAVARLLPPPRPAAEPARAEDLGVRLRAPDRGAVAFLVAEGDSVALRVARDAQADTAVACPDPACSAGVVAALAWRPGLDQIVFSTSDTARGHAQSLRLWDLSTGAVRRVAEGEGLLGGGRDVDTNEACAVGAVFAVCVSAAANTPPRLERIALDSGERRVLYEPNRALALAAGPPARALAWTDASGHAFTGVFFPPAGVAGPAPLFVTYYSCPGFLRGGAGDEWPLASLAGAGIGALCVNEAAGGDRIHPDQLARFRIAASGVGAIIDRLARQGLVDPQRVGMGGFSFGSEVVFWEAMTSHRLAAASVASTAMTPTYYRFHSLQGPRILDVVKHMWGLGAPAETPDRWALISPAFNVDRIRTPLLLQMPEQEYLQTLDYVAPLMNSATPTDLYVFPGEPHQKVQPRHKLAIYQRNLDWFRFWLQGYVDPDPAKAHQYALWTGMRRRAEAAGQQPGRGDAVSP
jgi:dipeptidyl aminopeptidase/acylaminoacyl peptidase